MSGKNEASRSPDGPAPASRRRNSLSRAVSYVRQSLPGLPGRRASRAAARLLIATQTSRDKEVARERLEDACNACSVEALQEAIRYAGEKDLDTDEMYSDAYMKAVVKLAKEERKQEARTRLADACEKGKKAGLQEAIGAAKEEGLTSEDLIVAENLLESVERKLAAMGELKKAYLGILKSSDHGSDAFQAKLNAFKVSLGQAGNAGFDAAQLTLRLDAPRWLFVGNPGAGKSTLMNCKAKEIMFKSNLSSGRGVTFQLDIDMDEDWNVYFDTPGLADVALRKEAAESISRALGKGGKFRVIIVVLQQQGRVRPEDRTTMKLILDAIPEIGTQYTVVVNQCGIGAMKKFEENGEFRKTFLSYLFQGMPNPTDRVFFLPTVTVMDGAEDQIMPLPEHFSKFLDEAPYVELKPGQAKEVNSDTYDDALTKIAELKEQSEEEKQHILKQVEDAKKANDAMAKRAEEEKDRLEKQVAEARKAAEVERAKALKAQEEYQKKEKKEKEEFQRQVKHQQEELEKERRKLMEDEAKNRQKLQEEARIKMEAALKKHQSDKAAADKAKEELARQFAEEKQKLQGMYIEKVREAEEDAKRKERAMKDEYDKSVRQANLELERQIRPAATGAVAAPAAAGASGAAIAAMIGMGAGAICGGPAGAAAGSALGSWIGGLFG
ncbi:unnamed protein product [Prorocentrum cordatum]|uniref:G domain-containing protein n=1 Tax=Prorocentrum cordatum TaxID=2364126 RepID=A0ABN9SRA6_9DINO|nr:unnamed protein product [Polarella glacialis]